MASFNSEGKHRDHAFCCISFYWDTSVHFYRHYSKTHFVPDARIHCPDHIIINIAPNVLTSVIA